MRKGPGRHRLSEVRSRQDTLGVLETLHLGLTSGFTKIVVIDQEITVRVELRDVALDVREISLLRSLLLLRALHVAVEVGLRRLLRRDALHVLRARRLRLRHQALVVLLRSLLLVLRLSDAVLEVLAQHIHERDDTVRLPVLLLVRAPGLRRRGRGRVVLELHEQHRLRRARDHHRRIRRDHVRGARRREELLLVRQLTLRRLLVEVRAVELVQLVLRLLDQLHRRAVLRLESQEGTVVFLALLSGLRNRLVKRLHIRLQGGNLLRESRARRRHILDRRLARRDGRLRGSLLLLALRQVLVAEGLLLVIVRLLLAQHGHHAVNHGQNLREVNLLRLQAKLDERELGVVSAALQAREELARAEHHGRRRALLEEAHRGLRQRQGLLEEVQRVIIVEHLDRLRDRRDLLRAHLRALSPFLLLR